jgi:hypothetical protein
MVGLNFLLSFTSRSQTFALARQMTRQEIASDELVREMQAGDSAAGKAFRAQAMANKGRG